VTVPRFFRGNDFYFSMFMRHYENCLDHRAAFRLQVGQLVVPEVKWKKILVVAASLVHCSAIKKKVVVASQS